MVNFIISPCRLARPGEFDQGGGIRGSFVPWHCFGTIKRSLGYDYFLCRGKRAVATEVNLTLLAYNLKRVCNLVGVQNLIAVVS